MTFLTVGWGPVINAGLPPQHPGDGSTPIATVGWLPKLGTAFYPYPHDDPDAAGAARPSSRPAESA
ncbi:hypothetical protein VSR01_03105 [Actinacidiphila sp. DG2A-62]|jgi:hypothetical protein|uniref:hypothetical protein n=1 Tax=Actinacidiphila sp. DG2A-62 TaxID=3108821 RepID=UPI002DB71793|nr:hypothetical protein [Actinacidiphila sp. DG2A-62]MEC3992588.1 hypothetical protein [Actinacidiphila sp. DG2A-62]